MNLNLKLSISIFDAQASKAVFNLHRSPIVMPMVSQKFRFASLRVLTTTHRIFLRSGKNAEASTDLPSNTNIIIYHYLKSDIRNDK
jgi:hypothetical protein